ncbi:hypothetical protein GQ457_01G050470 [Hibiscus cannabinus]
MGEEKSENQRAFVDEENGRSEIAVAPGEKSQVDGKENGVGWTVFVDNLSRRVSRGALWELFSHHGKVNHVFIPLKNKKPKYRFSTFAFVRFDSEKAMNRAIEKTNKSKIDEKIITVARAKFPVQMRRKFVPLNQGTVFIATDRVGANKKEILNPIPPEINSKNSAGLDSRSFRDVLIGQSKHNRGNISLEAGKPGGGGVTHRSLFDIHIPAKDIAWIDRSLVGVLKHHYDLEFIQRAILRDGLNARVARWGNFELSCIITFNSSEDFDEALNKRDEGLSFWFSHVAPLINEKGVPASYLSVSLVGVPLHCWHESFFKSLGNRWGTFIAIEEDTREMKNFSVAKMIIRAESPFDVPSSLTVRSLDRSFIIKVSIAEHTKVHGEVNVELDGGNFADVWPAEKAPAGTVQRSSDLYSQSSPSDEGVPEARMEDALQNGFDGVELDPQVSQSSKINTPVLGNSLDIGILENIPHTKRTTEDVCSPIGGKDFGTHGIHLAEEGVNPGLCQAKNNFNIPPGFGPNGSNTHGGCSRSIEIANRSNIRMTGYSIESGGKPTISPTFEFVPDSFEGLENASLIKENSGGLEQCVEFNPNIQCPLIANLSRSDSFGLQCPSLRRAVRLSIRNVLDEPRSLEADSDPTFQKEDSNILDEAVAIWEVSRVLDISFKGGREMVIKRPGVSLVCGIEMLLLSQIRRFLQESCLMDLPLKGGEYTWSNGRDTPTLVRLDRFLVNADFLSAFHYLEQCLLSKSISDHNAIALIFDERNWGPKPFKFFNYYLDEEGFIEMVHSCIQNNAGNKRSLGVFHLLKNVKGAIKDWNKSHCHSPGKSIKALEKEIHILELEQQKGCKDSLLSRKLATLRSALWKELRVEERAWLQKSRLKWFKEGDHNTNFFHLTASNRRRFNSLRGIRYKGTSLFDPSEILKCVHKFFSAAYNVESALEVEDFNLSFSGISLSQQASLEAMFTKEEVWRAICSSDSNKAPGPDDFNMGFFKTFWSKLENPIMQFFTDFFAGKKWEDGINHSFITLIPKKHNPESLEDFRPISLVGGIYKILSKVLAGRLNQCADTIIGDSQFAFIKGRQILDCSFIANECIDEIVKRKSRGVVFKIDFSRAYDTVSWDFLMRIMKKMNFGEKWCDWIFKCISSATISVLANGVPSDRFEISRGLRQGCSLSPMLFNIVGEALNRLLSKAVESGLFSGFVIGKGDGQTMVSHLQFADDLMIFCEASLEQVLNVKRVLRVFELASGLQLNLKKSMIFGINVAEEDLSHWADLVGCDVGHFPTSYLGLPLGHRRNSAALWDPIVEKFNGRLASWKSATLSFGGRLVLLKSVLSSLPIYFMSIFRMPVAVYQKLSSIMANFLWGGSLDRRRIHWVKWSDVCLPIDNGGLGIVDLNIQNRALLGKWIWKFANEKGVWKKVLASKYNYDLNCLIPNSRYRGKQSWIWNGVTRSFEKNDHFGVCLRSKFNVQLGDGKSINFWNDTWACEIPLRIKFPRIFVVCQNKSSVVADFGYKVNGVWSWNIPLRRQLFDWELEIWDSLLALLQGGRFSNFNCDWLSWTGSGSGKFSVKSVIHNLHSKLPSCKEWNMLVWRGVAPPKVEIFSWLVIRQRIPVRVNLAARGLILSPISDVSCPLCGQAPESVAHLLFSCTVTWNVWMRCAAYWGLSLVFPNDPKAFLLAWHGFGVSKSIDSIWHLIPFAVLWTIWLFRNDIIFSKSRLDCTQIFFLVRKRVTSWFKANWPESDCSAEAIMSDPSITNNCSLLRSETSVLHVWEAPPFGFVKINVDGAMVTDGSKGGIGGILRDSTGTCLASFSLPIGPGPVVLAELEAVKHGLELFFSLSELQGSRLILESDCSTVVDWISNSAPCPPAFVSLLRQALAEVLEHDCSLAAMSTGWRSVFAVSTYVKLKGVLFDWFVNFA